MQGGEIAHFRAAVYHSLMRCQLESGPTTVQTNGLAALNNNTAAALNVEKSCPPPYSVSQPSVHLPAVLRRLAGDPGKSAVFCGSPHIIPGDVSVLGQSQSLGAEWTLGYTIAKSAQLDSNRI